MESGGQHVEAEFENTARKKLENQTPRIFGKIEGILHGKISRVESERVKRQFTEAHETQTAALAAEEKGRWDELEADWTREIVPICRALNAMNATTGLISTAQK